MAQFASINKGYKEVNPCRINRQLVIKEPIRKMLNNKRLATFFDNGNRLIRQNFSA